jgi:hypothetical protein
MTKAVDINTNRRADNSSESKPASRVGFIQAPGLLEPT